MNDWWSLRGRVPRGVFWGRWAVSSGANVLALAVLGQISRENSAAAGFVTIVAILLVVAGTWIGLLNIAKRWKDMDVNPAMTFVTFVPLVGALVTLGICGCRPGTRGANRYGPDPLSDAPEEAPAAPDEPDENIRKYCVVCGGEWGAGLRACCTKTSLVDLRYTGGFRKQKHFFAPDGRELGAEDLAELRRREQEVASSSRA
jgi:uncharacterized membrane protein YhaH (DUF805 family)